MRVVTSSTWHTSSGKLKSIGSFAGWLGVSIVQTANNWCCEAVEGLRKDYLEIFAIFMIQLAFLSC